MTQASKEYAAALFSIALEKQCVRPWADAVGEMAECLREYPAYCDLLTSPEIPAEERESLMRAAFAGTPEEILRLAALMIQRGRAWEIPDTADRFRQLADEAEKHKTARVVSAAPLTEAEKERLIKRLAGDTGAKITLSCETDPALLGGMLVEIDGRVIDGTLRTKLRELKEVIGG